MTGKDPMLEAAARYAEKIVAEFTARPLTADEARSFAELISLGPALEVAARIEEMWYGGAAGREKVRSAWPELAAELDELVKENAL